MIEVKERLYVQPEDFFEKIQESIVYDIEKSVGKKIKPYKGYKYTKEMKSKLGKKGKVEILITEFNSPIIYSASFKSFQGINKISYLIKKVEDYCIDVTYTETFEGENKTKTLNFKFINFFYKNKAKKRAHNMLKAIEAYLQSN